MAVIIEVDTEFGQFDALGGTGVVAGGFVRTVVSANRE